MIRDEIIAQPPLLMRYTVHQRFASSPVCCSLPSQSTRIGSLDRSARHVPCGLILRAGGRLLLAGCAHRPTAPDDVRIEVLDVVIALVRQVEWIGFRVTAVIVNDGDSDVILAPCATHVQMERSDGWREVWAPICVSMDGPSRRIAAGDSSSEAIAVQWTTASSGPGRFPFSEVTAGR